MEWNYSKVRFFRKPNAIKLSYTQPNLGSISSSSSSNIGVLGSKNSVEFSKKIYIYIYTEKIVRVGNRKRRKH